jgi:hypothetical protein
MKMGTGGEDFIYPSSWPGLSQPSTSFRVAGKEDVDARDKPGHDEAGEIAKR